LLQHGATIIPNGIGVNTFLKDFSKNFSEAIRRLRGASSQAEFARLLGVNQPEVFRWEQGRVPKVDRLLQLAIRFGIILEDLLTGQTASHHLPVNTATDGHRAIDHMRRFVVEACAGNLAREGWTLVEVQKRFPLDMWREPTAPPKIQDSRGMPLSSTVAAALAMTRDADKALAENLDPTSAPFATTGVPTSHTPEPSGGTLAHPKKRPVLPVRVPNES
jgi:transcriptional regulator with XRE-family HTH domain